MQYALYRIFTEILLWLKSEPILTLFSSLNNTQPLLFIVNNNFKSLLLLAQASLANVNTFTYEKDVRFNSQTGQI